jgi:hypothetical protein
LKICSVDACDNENLAKGYCRKHYLQIYRNDRLLPRTIYDENKIILYDNYAEMELYDKYGNTKCTTIFDLDFVDKVKSLKWGLNGGYVVNKKTEVNLHNFILNSDLRVDHIDRNKLNNLSENLRECSFQENNRNKSLHKNNQTGITGVGWRNDSNIWIASITVDYKKVSLGCYSNIEDATKARLFAEKKYFGNFAPQQHLFEEYGIL